MMQPRETCAPSNCENARIWTPLSTVTPGPNTTFWQLALDGTPVGKVTSAVYSPRLKQNIALAMVAVDCAEIGTELTLTTGAGTRSGIIAERPFFDPKKSIATG